MCACQLNRRVGRENDAPGLHDLRDSGAIEEDATEVLMFHRDWDAASADDRSEGRVDATRSWLFVRKNRYGDNNKRVEMVFHASESRLEPLQVPGGMLT